MDDKSHLQIIEGETKEMRKKRLNKKPIEPVNSPIQNENKLMIEMLKANQNGEVFEMASLYKQCSEIDTLKQRLKKFEMNIQERGCENAKQRLSQVKQLIEEGIV